MDNESYNSLITEIKWGNECWNNGNEILKWWIW